jgi:hypothetical protein
MAQHVEFTGQMLNEYCTFVQTIHGKENHANILSR